MKYVCLLGVACVAILLLAPIVCALSPMGTANYEMGRLAYFGHLSVGGETFHGTATIKIVLLRNGDVAWSNDGSSERGEEPDAAMSVEVAQGDFSVVLGRPGRRRWTPVSTSRMR